MNDPKTLADTQNLSLSPSARQLAKQTHKTKEVKMNKQIKQRQRTYFSASSDTMKSTFSGRVSRSCPMARESRSAAEVAAHGRSGGGCFAIRF